MAVMIGYLRRSIFWLFLAATAYSTLMPVPPVDPTQSNDKLQHAVAFGLLTLTLAISYPRLRWWQMALIAIAIGGMVEILQGVMGLGRSADWYDWGADIIGAVATAIPIAVFRHLSRR